MSGLICLQGGAEFGRRCVDMDSELLRRAPEGDVVVLAGAAAPGREYAVATRNARSYYSGLTDRAVVGAVASRTDPLSFIEASRSAGLIVLPGGSPARLLDVLSGDMRRALVGAHDRGAAISGASAGAMVLCAHTVLPGQGITEGLGLVPGVAIPHFDGSNWWNLDLPADVPRWGLPECGGLVFGGEATFALGMEGAERLEGGRAVRIDRLPI